MTYQNGDVIRVTARLAHGPDDIQNVYHYLVNGMTADQTDLAGDAVLIAEMDDLYDNLNPIISVDVDYIDIVLQNITAGTPARYRDWTTQTSGSKIGTLMPGQVAGLALFPSDFSRSQGRKYIGGATEEDSQSPGVPVANYLTALSNFVSDALLIPSLGGGLLYPGNWSPSKNRFASWNGGTVATYWATQRRRRKGVGS